MLGLPVHEDWGKLVVMQAGGIAISRAQLNLGPCAIVVEATAIQEAYSGLADLSSEPPIAAGEHRAKGERHAWGCGQAPLACDVHAAGMRAFLGPCDMSTLSGAPLAEDQHIPFRTAVL